MISIRRTPIAALLLAATGLATAQTAAAPADGQWRGLGGAALSLSSGNTTSRSLLINAEASRATQADRISLGGNYNRAEGENSAGEDEKTADKWALFGQYDYNLSARTYVFGRLGVEGDRLIDLSSRTAVATGLGYKVIDTAPLKFEVFGGLGWTSDRYRNAQLIDGSIDTRFSRTAIYLGEASQHQLTPTVSFRQRLELYPGISGDKAVLAKFSAGLGVAMNSTMTLNVGLTSTYNSKPADGVKKNDVGLFTGINVKFGAI